MEETCTLIDDIEQLIFQNTSLLKLIQGFCIMAQQNDVDEMEYVAQGLEVVIANQNKLLADVNIVSDNVYRNTYPKFYNSISP